MSNVARQVVTGVCSRVHSKSAITSWWVVVLKAFHLISVVGLPGVVHRDLKLENLLLVDESFDSAVKIADFGLSKFFGKNEAVLVTMCGSPEYVAPEVLGVDEYSDHYTPAVDMWSVGVVLFAMMCCYTPFCEFCCLS